MDQYQPPPLNLGRGAHRAALRASAGLTTKEYPVPWWQTALAATGAGVGPIVLGFLGWAWWHSTREGE